MKYNGFTNWETWNVMLWVINPESIYNSLRWVFNRHVVDVKRVKSFVLGFFPHGTPDMFGHCDYKNVNWDELTEHFKETFS